MNPELSSSPLEKQSLPCFGLNKCNFLHFNFHWQLNKHCILIFPDILDHDHQEDIQVRTYQGTKKDRLMDGKRGIRKVPLSGGGRDNIGLWGEVPRPGLQINMTNGAPVVTEIMRPQWQECDTQSISSVRHCIQCYVICRDTVQCQCETSIIQ